MIVREQFVRVNRYTRPAMKNSGIKGVVWHYTASPKAPAQNIRNYFDGTCVNQQRYASAHVAIDKKEVIVMIPFDEVAYHAHDRSRCYVKQLYPNANYTSIGVELCVDANNQLEPETYKNAVEYGAMLCKQFKLDPRKDFFRHYDVTEKNCPAFWVADPSGFEKFKQDVFAKLNEQPAPAPKPEPKPANELITPIMYPRQGVATITADVLNVREGAGTQYKVVKQVRKGEKYKVFGSRPDWLNVGGNQWIHANYATVVYDDEKPAPKGDMSTDSIVEYLKSIGVDSSFANRKKLAGQYGISGYKGTAEQNTLLLKKMRGR